MSSAQKQIHFELTAEQVFLSSLHSLIMLASAKSYRQTSLSHLSIFCSVFLLYLLFLGYHSIKYLHHLLSSLLAMCPTHFHFHCLIIPMIFFLISVCSLIHVDLFFLSLSRLFCSLICM